MSKSSAVLKKLKQENPDLKTNRRLQKNKNYYKPKNSSSKAVITPDGKQLNNSKKIIFNLEVGDIVNVTFFNDPCLGIIISTKSYKVRDTTIKSNVVKMLETNNFLVFAKSNLYIIKGNYLSKL